MKKTKTAVPKQKISGAKLWAKIYKYRGFYLMFLPVFVFAIIFSYLPMLGIVLGFTDYNGIKDPTFVGFKHFERMFKMANFWSAFANTIVISLVKLILTTLFAVIVSLLLNEIVNLHFKKVVQTIIYLPHFMSWVVTASIFSLILAPTNHGLVNTFLVNIGVLDANNMIYFLGSEKWWRFA